MQCMTAGKDRIVAMQKVMHALDARYLADETLPLQVSLRTLLSTFCNDKQKRLAAGQHMLPGPKSDLHII